MPYRVQPRSMLDSLSGWENLGASQQRRQINALALQDRERGLQEQAAIRNALSGLGPDATEEQAAVTLRRLGTPTAIDYADKINKNAIERQKSTALVKEQEVKARELEARKAVEDIKVFSYFLNGVGADPRPEVLEAALSEIEKRTGTPMGALGVSLRQHANDPAKLSEIATSWALDAKSRLPETVESDTGGSKDFYNRSRVTGKVTSMGSTPKTPTPGEVLTDERQREHNREIERLRGLEVSGNNRAPKQASLVDPNNQGQMILVDLNKWDPSATGPTERRPGYLGVAGKEPTRALREQKQSAGKESFDAIVDDMSNAYDFLEKKGAIVSTEASAPANIKSSIQSSALGQMAGGVIGTEEQSARNVINQSRPLLVSAIAEATGMTSKQVDSNADVKRWLDAASDPKKDIQSQRKALQRLRDYVAIKSGGMMSFASEAEAEAAEKAGRLKKGQRIRINGQTGTWQ